MTFTEFLEIVQTNGLRLDTKRSALLEQYAHLLKEQNGKVNLISRKDEENIFEKHLLHSLTLAMPEVTGFTIPNGASVFDVGTGGGLPGIPLAIVRDDITVTLCDSIAKKIKADEEMIDSLRLENVTAIISRAEDLAKQKEFFGRFDIVVSRAVAPLDDLVKWTRGLLKKNGALLCLKGGDIQEEIKRTKRIKDVERVTEAPLALRGYNGFINDAKNIVTVLLG
ncbi:MAG TPA: 16S rRNA (guanine(527)-N(7))-methyltransferase RsmG [Candidatus Kapabacteria bacterium]|nr:16S rRNA (guanine(527)-N(7))-methyltransferase RsmG [Candidatus Kapabacteria bacterium]